MHAHEYRLLGASCSEKSELGKIANFVKCQSIFILAICCSHYLSATIEAKTSFSFLSGEELNYKTRWAPDKTVAMDDF